VVVDSLRHLGQCYQAVFYVDGNDEHRYHLDDLNSSYADLAKKIRRIPNVVYLQDNVAVVDGVAIVGTNGWWTYDFDPGIDAEQSSLWFQDYAKVNGTVAKAVGRMARTDSTYMINSVKRLQTHNDVNKIVCVTHTVPNASLVAHDIGLADTLRFNTMGNSFMMQALSADTEKKLQDQLTIEKKIWEDHAKSNKIIVTEENVAEVVSMMCGIPVNKISQTETGKLVNMGEIIRGKVIGQEEAVEKVVKAIQRNRAGLKDPNRPIGSFIFLGQTGVGKTQLAKVISKELFDSEDALIRIDMSEYMEKFAISRLIGAPPGYVGYEEGGQLTEKVRRKPYCVVLLDEIEKAHPDVFNMMLQVLDDGYLTDSLGRKIDFKNTIIIMTSNVGARQLKDFGQGVGFGTAAKIAQADDNSKSVIENALKKTFAPEFLNRIDDVIVFNPLEKHDIDLIIEIELKKLYVRVAELGYTLNLSDAAKAYISEKGFDKQFGARPLKRAIQKYVEDALAEEIITSKISSGDVIFMDLEEATQELKVVVKKAKKPTS
jgi:ATP-dependent Clp protease ATP-binding subunit ClpA